MSYAGNLEGCYCDGGTGHEDLEDSDSFSMPSTAFSGPVQISLEDNLPAGGFAPSGLPSDGPQRAKKRHLSQKERLRLKKKSVSAKVLVLGTFGVGKSTLINYLVDHTGKTKVAKQGRGARGVTQKVEEVYKDHVEHRGSSVQMSFFDSPGFGDPDKDETEQTQNLHQVTACLAGGVHAIILVVKMGRQNQDDRALPEIFLSCLVSEDEESLERKEFVSRIQLVVTHADNDDHHVSQTEIDTFRGQLLEIYPTEFDGVVRKAIFVENGRAGDGSPYGDREQNADLILEHVRQCLPRGIYTSKNLDEILQIAFQKAFDKWAPVGSDLDTMDGAQLTTLFQFFRTVLERREWIEMTAATCANAEFRNKWNSLAISPKKDVALRLAERLVEQVADAAGNTWTGWLRGVPKKITEMFHKLTGTNRQAQQAVDHSPQTRLAAVRTNQQAQQAANHGTNRRTHQVAARSQQTRIAARPPPPPPAQTGEICIIQ